MSVRARVLAALAVTLLAPGLAAAQPRHAYAPPGIADQGLVFSGRLGYGVPNGDFAGFGFAGAPAPLSDTVSSKIPIWLELGYRFTPAVWTSLFLELSPTNVKSSACAAGFDCSASDVRFGLELQYHFLPREQLDPWLGVGFGVEFLNVKSEGPAPTVEQRFSGWELPLLEGGLDLAVNPHFAFGPYAALSFGRYSSYREREGGVTLFDGSIDDRAWHGWFQVGVKGTIKL